MLSDDAFVFLGWILKGIRMVKRCTEVRQVRQVHVVRVVVPSVGCARTARCAGARASPSHWGVLSGNGKAGGNHAWATRHRPNVTVMTVMGALSFPIAQVDSNDLDIYLGIYDNLRRYFLDICFVSLFSFSLTIWTAAYDFDESSDARVWSLA